MELDAAPNARRLWHEIVIFSDADEPSSIEANNPSHSRANDGISHVGPVMDYVRTTGVVRMAWVCAAVCFLSLDTGWITPNDVHVRIRCDALGPAFADSCYGRSAAAACYALDNSSGGMALG